jgi:hypothetical protein
MTAYLWLQEGGTLSDVKVWRVRDGLVEEILENFIPVVAEMSKSHFYDSWPKKKSGLCAKWCGVFDCRFNGKYLEWAKEHQIGD